MERYLPASRLTLISHAATDAQRRGAFPSDEPLDAGERERVERLGWVASRVQRMLCGPELRTRETAEALGLTAEVSAALSDCNFGRWCGAELEAVQESEPEGMVSWLTEMAAAPHGGESIVELIERVGGWMEEQQEAGHVVAVTHPAVIRCAMVSALAAPAEAFWRVDISPLTVTDLRFNGRPKGRGWTLRASGSALR